MKTSKLLIIGVLLNIAFYGYSQNITSITTVSNGFIIDFTLPDYTIQDTNIYEEFGINQTYSYIGMEQLGNIEDIGYPYLPQYTIDLHVPDDASTFNVSVSNRVTETENLSHKIFPAQDVSDEDNQSFTIENSYYSTNGSLFDFDYQVSETFNIMGAKGISFSIFPFQYNPSLDRIEVIKSCRFTITHNGSSSIQLKSASVDRTVTNTYLGNIFENYPTLKSGTLEKGRYLIITDPDFENNLTYFANYKRNIGYDVTVVNTSTTGNTASSIKNYIQTQYNNANTRPTFVLLVGDHGDIPASGGSIQGYYADPLTDLDYTLLSGDDYFADVFLGRFSISDIIDLQNIINKTINMETNLHNFNKNAILLAGGGDGENKFAKTQRWVISNVLDPQNIDCDHNYATEGATRADGLAALNGNYTFFIYRGHGGVTGLGEPFNLVGTDINSSSNIVYPFGFGFACLTNNFGYSSAPSFGERWIRSLHGGISYFGATTTTYRHINNVIEKRIFMMLEYEYQLSPLINLGMKDYYKRFWSFLSGDNRKKHMKTYNLLGDPSIYLDGIGCQDSYIFTNNETFHNGDRITYQASSNISVADGNATFTLQSGSIVNLIAGGSIMLNPGFFAEQGSQFNAKIAPCSQ